MPQFLSGPRRLRFATAALVAACLSAAPSPLAAQDAPSAALDRDLAELAARPDAGLADVWVIFAAQPAATIADDLRPGYDRLVESARAPALAALARIEPLLPPRDERARLGVAGVMALERTLLTDEERAAIRAAHAETLRILAEMRTRILSAARGPCDAEQAPVVAWIESLPDARIEVRTVVLDALVARIPASALPDLARTFRGIARIARAHRRGVSLDKSVATIGASNWTSQSYSGGGVKVAVVDTGVDSGHPSLTTSSNAAVVTASAVNLSNASLYDPDFGDDASSTDDFHGHGTHCAGIVASNDSLYRGVAPGTSVLNAKCFYRTTSGAGSAFDADIVAGIDWALTNGANVLSCSYGGGGTSDGTDPLTIFHDAVVEVAGVPAAVAAGNSGQQGAGSVALPADGFNVLTVGAFDTNGTTSLSDDSLAYFSSLGPTFDGRRKPDLCAPGYQIYSLNAFWEGWNGTHDFIPKSGTSMATPHVAGSMSLLLSYNAAWQPEALKALLANSCRNSSPVTGTPDSNWGCGALDLGQAYTDRTRAFAATLTSAGPTAHYYRLGSLASGGRTTIAWNRAATYSGTTAASGGGSASALVNLDLYLYDGADGTQAASSASTVDSLEQVAASSAISDAVVKVDRAGSFPSGKTSQRYGLASVNDATAANPPDLVVTATSAPSDLAGSAQFTFTATVKNQGDLRAPSPAVTLTLPSGFSLAGSSATQTLSSLDPFATGGGTATASWTVVTGTTSGVFTLSVTAAATGFGATFTSTAATQSVSVDAAAPAANAGADVSLFATSGAGRTISLDGSASTDDNASKGLAYAWDTDADGAFDDTPGSATGATPSVAFPIGSRTVTLRVTDYVGNAGTDTVVVEVKDNPPVAAAGADRTADEGSAVAFDGRSSTDVEGAIASYAWSFGDGTTATGATPSHAFRNDGTYTVTLTVTDSAGQTATDTAIVTVLNVAPTANAGAALAGAEGSGVAFSGSATDPGADDVLAYSWTFGDGATASGPAPSHVYAQDGVYTATLTVTDGDGGAGTSTVKVTVANVAPVAVAGPAAESNEGDAVAFDGSATDAGVLDVLTYSWEFGDGGTASSAAATHVYTQDGVYTATLTVTDDAGASSASTRVVTVANVAPELTLPASLRVDVGTPLDLHLVPTDASPDDAAALVTTWKVLDAAGATVASGAGVDVAWPADRKMEGTLVVAVADDDVSIERRAALSAATPPLGDTFEAATAAGLGAAVERKVLLDVLAARAAASTPGRSKAASRRLSAAVKFLARHGVASGPLVARLTVLAADCAAGTALPAERALALPAAVGGTDALLDAAPRAGLAPRRAARLIAALIDLRFAARAGVARKTAAAKKHALAAAAPLPAGPVADWFRASIAAQ